MKQLVNEVYEPLFTEHPRYFILMGGRGAGRSTVASQFANAKLIAPEYFRCAIMRYVLGDIRNSIYREITDRAEENGIIEHLDINESTMTIKYGGNSINAVGFRKSSSDQKAKLKSLANYSCVIIEEAEEIPEEDFMQLDDSLRTLKGDIIVILLLNPPAKNHWIIQRWFDLIPSEKKDFYVPRLKKEVTDTIFIGTNYKVNEKNLSKQSIALYNSYRETKSHHYWNMIEGLIPEVVHGRIYSGWKIIEEIPHEAKLERYGLDFGYSNDPTAIVAVYRYNGGFIFDEITYSKGLLNKQIADVILNLNKALVVADSAEPKSIDELKSYTVDVIPCDKSSQNNQSSVRWGIDLVKDQRISITKHSINILNEYNNYAWRTDKDGNYLNEPGFLWNHAMDAIRYAISTIPKLIQPLTGEQKEAKSFQSAMKRKKLYQQGKRTFV